MEKKKNITDAAKIFRDNFEEIYVSNYRGMVRFAKEFVGNREDAENIVQDAFTDIWETGSKALYEKNHILGLLFTSIKNRCIDLLRHNIIVREVENLMQEKFRRDMKMKFDTLEAFDRDLFMSDERIDEIINNSINTLPEKCRQIFVMNKIEGKKHVIIAEELNISVNTVETQMGIAYKKLREELKNYLPLVTFLFYLNS